MSAARPQFALYPPDETLKMSNDLRSGKDEISGWLEDNLRPTLDTAHREFLWQYLSIYDQWTRIHAQYPSLDDQASLTYLTERAEDALRAIAADKPTRLWLSVVRSLPLPVVAHIAMTEDSSQVIKLVKIASAGASLYGYRRPKNMPDDGNSLLVEAEWLQDFKERLSTEVPRFIGAAHTWYYALGWYRIAGKGGVLAPPAPVDMKAARRSLDALPPNDLGLGVHLVVGSAAVVHAALYRVPRRP